jgi:hypothetical protein
MREEIRLGNEALAQDDLETATKHFQHLLDEGGTPVQERIATNRLQEIRGLLAARNKPPAKSRARRKVSAKDTPDASAKRP